MTSPSDRSASRSSFAGAWDRYVDQAKGAGQDWPGDDWGDASLWDGWFDLLLGKHGASGWQRVVEIGQGTGKYTGRMLTAGPQAQVLACDVSARFLELCRQRLAAFVDAGRLDTAQLDEKDPDGLAGAVAAKGWAGQVDAVFSIDTLVHLTFTQVAALMLGATSVLRPGGVLAFTFACGTSRPGFEKLVGDIDRVLRAGSDPTTGCFHWVSPELVASTAEAMGYEVDVCGIDPMHGRDGHFVGRLVDAERAAQARALRRPVD